MTTLERIAALMRDPRLTSTQRLVGCEIITRLNPGPAEFVLKDIETTVHVSRRTIQSACARLVELGYLTIRERRGRANLYSIPIKGSPGISALVEPAA
jgi:DNA-binding GntR family transcriptional regulator